MASKSDKFMTWVRRAFGAESGTNDMKLLVKLEEAARIVTHDIDAMGEPDAKSLHALVRASKNLRREYEN